MTQQDILEQAKQGNSQAIAVFMNRQLQSKDITAKVALKGSCIQIMLESTQVPEQQELVTLICKSITTLGATYIERVKIYGRQIGEDFPAWSQEFELAGQQLPNPNLNAAQLVTSHISQTPISKAKPDTNNKSLPAQNANSVAQSRTKSKEVASEKHLTIWAGVTFLLSIVLFFINWVLAIISFVICGYFCVKASELQVAASEKIKTEQESLKQEQEILKQVEKQKIYLILLDPVNSPIKNLQTNLAQTALEEFRKVEARVNVGVSSNDLPAVLASAKYAVQQFERSKDYHVSLALNELIAEIMSYYELSQICLTRKAHRFTAAVIAVVEQPGIPINDVLGKQIQQYFPYLQDNSGHYQFDTVIQIIWAEASECNNKLQQVLDVVPQSRY